LQKYKILNIRLTLLFFSHTKNNFKKFRLKIIEFCWVLSLQKIPFDLTVTCFFGIEIYLWILPSFLAYHLSRFFLESGTSL